MKIEVAFKPLAEQPRSPFAPVDVAQRDWFKDGRIDAAFADLRREAPVSYCRDSAFGPYWSITRHADIEAIELDTGSFSSAHQFGGITLDGKPDAPDYFPMFIAMDPPDHATRRRAVLPAFNPTSLQRLATQIRTDVDAVLDALPVSEAFDWMDRVAIELTASTLATLLGFPQAERRQLVRWSNVMSTIPGYGVVATMEEKLAEMQACFKRFGTIWEERKAAAPAGDLISMLAHGEHTRDMTREEFCGTMILLIVAGNETTRNSIGGSIVALSRYPDQYDKLVADHSLLDGMVPEVMRWQSAVAHMRRTATRDVVFRGAHIRKGDKIVLWYLSGNRDEAAFDDADAFVIDRPNARRHLAFGHGIHRCIGARLGELQVRILWEAMLRRHARFALAAPPVRSASVFFSGYDEVQLRLSFR